MDEFDYWTEDRFDEAFAQAEPVEIVNRHMPGATTITAADVVSFTCPSCAAVVAIVDPTVRTPCPCGKTWARHGTLTSTFGWHATGASS